MIFKVTNCSEIYRFFGLIVLPSKCFDSEEITMNIRQQAQILLARQYQRSKHRSRSISSRLAAKIGCTLPTNKERLTELNQTM